MQVPKAIPLIEEGEGLFSLAGVTERPPRRLIGLREAERIPLWELDRKFVDGQGRERGVYTLVGLADTIGELYPWLVGQQGEK